MIAMESVMAQLAESAHEISEARPADVSTFEAALVVALQAVREANAAVHGYKCIDRVGIPAESELMELGAARDAAECSGVHIYVGGDEGAAALEPVGPAGLSTEVSARSSLSAQSSRQCSTRRPAVTGTNQTPFSPRKHALVDGVSELGTIAHLGPYRPVSEAEIASRANDLSGMEDVTLKQIVMTMLNTMIRVLLLSVGFSGAIGGTIALVKKVTLLGDAAFDYPRATYASLSLYATPPPTSDCLS